MSDCDVEKNECKVDKLANCIVGIREFADFLGIKYKKNVGNRALCEQINKKLESEKVPPIPVKGDTTSPFYITGSKKSVVAVEYQYLKKPVFQFSIDTLAIEKLGNITKSDGVETILVYWDGEDKPTEEPLNDVIETLTQDGNKQLLKDIEQKRALLAETTVAAAKPPASKEKKHVTIVEPNKRIEAPVDPPLRANDALPSDAELLEKGQELLNNARDASRYYSDSVPINDYFRANGKKEFDQLAHVNNEGCGDCMYLSLAPMLKILKPELFINVYQNPGESGLKNDAIHLRRLLAAVLPTTAEDLTNYYQAYASNYSRVAEANSFRKEYARKDKETDAEYRSRLQKHMLTREHWAHLPDFELLHNVLGNSVAIILIGGDNNFNIHPAGIVVEQLNNPNTRYLLILHNGEHYTRLQRKGTGQFAFSQEELRRDFPFLWKTFENIVHPGDFSRQLLLLKDEIFKTYPQLKAFEKPDNKDRGYEVIFDNLLHVDRKKEPEQWFNKNETTQIAKFESLNDDAKKILIDTLLAEIESNDTDELAKAAAEKVNNFVKEQKQKSATTTVASIFCAPLTENEKTRLEDIITTAEKVDKNAKFSGKYDDEREEVNKDAILRLQSHATYLKWLSSTDINAYVTKLARDVKANPSKYNSVDFFGTDVYTLMKNLKTVERPYKTFNQTENIFKLDKLFFPLNVQENHWILAVINFKTKEVEFYDSLCSESDDKQTIFNTITQYLVKLREKEKGNPIAWKFTKKDTPQQTNDKDCGVFVLACMEELVRKDFQGFTFQQKDAECFRRRILLDIVTVIPEIKTSSKKLPPPSIPKIETAPKKLAPPPMQLINTPSLGKDTQIMTQTSASTTQQITQQTQETTKEPTQTAKEPMQPSPEASLQTTPLNTIPLSLPQTTSLTVEQTSPDKEPTQKRRRIAKEPSPPSVATKEKITFDEEDIDPKDFGKFIN